MSSKRFSASRDDTVQVIACYGQNAPLLVALFFFLLILVPARPTKPVPKRSTVAGSGTCSGAGAVVVTSKRGVLTPETPVSLDAKKVGEVETVFLVRDNWNLGFCSYRDIPGQVLVAEKVFGTPVNLDLRAIGIYKSILDSYGLTTVLDSNSLLMFHKHQKPADSQPFGSS